MKNNIDVFYFSTLYPLHILFVEDGKMGELVRFSVLAVEEEVTRQAGCWVWKKGGHVRTPGGSSEMLPVSMQFHHWSLDDAGSWSDGILTCGISRCSQGSQTGF